MVVYILGVAALLGIVAETFEGVNIGDLTELIDFVATVLSLTLSSPILPIENFLLNLRESCDPSELHQESSSAPDTLGFKALS